MTSKEIYNKYKNELIGKRLAGEYIHKLSKEYEIPKGTLIKYFADDGIILTPFCKTQEYIDKVVDLYNQGYGLHKIGEMVHSGHQSVKRTLIEQGVKIRSVSEINRKWELNENYFDVIDTPNKAYILGFLFADGYNSLDKSSIRIALQEGDVDILEKMRSELGSSKPLKYLDFKGEIRPNGYTCKNMYQLEVYSKHMSQILDSLGMHQNKSLILKYPNYLKSEFHSHFIRGYFDGDGSITINRNKNTNNINRCCITITSTESFCSEIYNIMFQYFNANKFSIKDASCHNGITKFLYCSNRKDCLEFCNWLYKDADLFLKRKYQKYLQLKEYMSSQNK